MAPTVTTYSHNLDFKCSKNFEDRQTNQQTNAPRKQDMQNVAKLKFCKVLNHAKSADVIFLKNNNRPGIICMIS